MGSQYVKDNKTPLKSLLQSFSQIFWALWEKMSSKNSVLVIYEIWRLFVNVLTPDEKYSLSKSECLTQPIQMQLS